MLALLRLDPDSRPATIELVIDGIGAIAGQIVDPPNHAVRGHIRSSDATARGREQLQHALTEWVFALATERRLRLLVDDLHPSDEESGGWLAALALTLRFRRRNGGAHEAAAGRSYNQHRWPQPPGSEALELLGWAIERLERLVAQEQGRYTAPHGVRSRKRR